MATVPIEIVLQDPNNPIVPTPDSDGGSDNTNSNIAVPNTAVGEGHTTMDGSSDNSNIFTGPTATVSIVSVVILALALSGIITLLIHKYYKNKKTNTKTKATKKEHLTIAATSTMAVLAATVLVGQLSMTATNAATSDVDNGASLSTPDKIQIIANRYEDVTIVASTKAVSYASTDTSFGYKIFMSMTGDNANLYLDGDTASEYYFAPTTRAGLSNNSWGYSLDDGAEQAMPLVSDPLMAQQSLEAVEDQEFTVYYTMKADKDMPFGVYSGEIAYGIQGYNGFPTSLITMQQMTSEVCDAVYTPGNSVTDVVPTTTLIDNRDQKTYEVAKLADGNCWMTQNLDLDLSTSTELTPANTNISSNWTPTNSTIAFTGTTVTGWQNDSNVPYSADPGELYIYSSGTTNRDDQYTSLEDCKAAHPDCSKKNHVGNYYNWSAAVANNNTEGITGQYTNVTTSVCPAGWRLPIGRQSDDPISNNEWGTLIDDYAILGETSSCGSTCISYNYAVGGFNAIRNNPLLLIRTGEIYMYGQPTADSVGRNGYYWSDTVNGAYNAFNFSFNSSYINFETGSRGTGMSVRCIVGQ